MSKAVQRFEKWWTVAIQPGAQKMKVDKMTEELTKFVYDGNRLKFEVHDLPPLDVLMVWHAYHLNPRAFLEDSVRYGKLDFWRAGFPWEAVNASIGNHNFVYTGTRYAMAAWVQKMGYPWDSLDDPDAVTMKCPRCEKDMTVPWTGYDKGGDAWEDAETIHEKLSQGFADNSMTLGCPACDCYISHDELRLNKFWTDFFALQVQNEPMPGTILNLNGRPTIQSEQPLLTLLGIPDPVNRRKHIMFPNRLLNSDPSLRERFWQVTKPGEGRTIEHVRAEIESLLLDRPMVMKANDSHNANLIKDEKVAIRRMMSRYWENSSPFSLDLVGAVIRQGSFIQKMHSINWLHSPAATSTMTRLLTRYERYISIISEHTNHVAVPTLDIDLAWHTHQLSPAEYYKYVEWHTNKFVDHDDKIAETKLSDAFEWTSKVYQKKYKELYSECTCWYCAAIREASHNPASSGLKAAFGGGKTDKAITSQLSALYNTAKGGESGIHISAHSAIRPARKAGEDPSEKAEKHAKELQDHYQRYCKRAQKSGAAEHREAEASPKSKKYAAPTLFPIPFAVPYASDPDVTPDIYPANPACASFVQGSAGNCVSGACGGGVAAGACGGNGAGGCIAGGGGGATCGFAVGGDGGGGGGDGGGGCGSF